MSKESGKIKKIMAIVETGALLGSEGDEVKKNLWESNVYLGPDGFVYHIFAQPAQSGIKAHISGKRPVGEYLRWVDGLFQPGELPSESTGVHFRAARKLRELL